MSGRRDIVHAKPEQELKVASKGLIRAAGGVDGAGETVGCRHQRMSDCGNPNTPDFLRVEEVGKLEDVTVGAVGHPHVTRQLARRQGYALVKLPSGQIAGADLLRLMGPRAKEFGDTTNSLCMAMADGNVDVDEAEKVLADIDDELQLLVSIQAALAAIVAEQRGR